MQATETKQFILIKEILATEIQPHCLILRHLKEREADENSFEDAGGNGKATALSCMIEAS